MNYVKNKRKLGYHGEEKALAYLKEKSYKLIKKNYHAGKLGEIDLIVEDRNYIVFVEVKYCQTDSFGLPHYKINRAKQKKILKIAEIFLSQHEVSKDCRLDIIVIYKKNHEEIIEHIEDAFRG